jgi:predicted RNA-binding protein with PUA-like domain
MARWLVKEEPSHYSYADLVRDGKAAWSGVHNALALRHLKSMAPGDGVLYYHSGSERAIVGVAEVGSRPKPDPSDARGSWTVDLRPVRALDRAVPLSRIKADPAFADFALVRISRLSILPVPAPLWARLLRMARG